MVLYQRRRSISCSYYAAGRGRGAAAAAATATAPPLSPPPPPAPPPPPPPPQQRLTATRTRTSPNTSAHVPPFYFDRHLAFIDFRAFSQPNPAYITILREPIARQVSAFGFFQQCVCETVGQWTPKIAADRGEQGNASAIQPALYRLAPDKVAKVSEFLTRYCSRGYPLG